jgi:hypothetical protein
VQTNTPPSPFISSKTAAIFIAVMADLFLLSATIPKLGHVAISNQATQVAGVTVTLPVPVRHFSATDVLMIALMVLPLLLVIAGTLASRKVVAYIGWAFLAGLAVMHFLR